MNVYRLVLGIVLGVAIALGLLFGLTTGYALVQAAPSDPTKDHDEAISRALTYLETQQLPGGGIESDFSPGTPDDFTTIKTVFALAAADRPISYLTSGNGNTLLDYLESRAFTYTRDMTGTVYPGRIGMTIAATVAGNANPYAFAQYPAGHSSEGTAIDLVDELKDTYHPATGAYSTTAKGPFTTGDANGTNQLWAMVALASIQETVPVAAVDFFLDLQEADGGWAWVTGSGGDVDMTGLGMQALLASGFVEPTNVQIQEGLHFLRETQLDSGGWAGYYGTINADTTAAAIQAIAATGYRPATVSWAAQQARTPHDSLLGLQDANGSFGDNALATAHAIAGLAEAPVPILGRLQRTTRALTWMNEQQHADGSWSGFVGPDPGATCDAALAYAAAGFDPGSVAAPGSSISAMDYLSATASSFVLKSADSAGKLALVVEAAGGDAHNFGGVDIVHTVTNTWYSPTLGTFGVPTNTWHQAWSILGLDAAGETAPMSAAQALVDLQDTNGGWKYDLAETWWNTTTPDNTGLAIQALVAANVPVTSSSVVSGTSFLRSQQDLKGGWGNANATAYAMQGLLAAGENLTADWTTEQGHGPYNALSNLQKSDGPFVFGSDDDAFSTRQAVPALIGAHYPLSRTLRPFVSVNRGPDPDRTVAVDPRVEWSDGIGVIIPFGSDLDGDGAVELAWREVVSTSWETATAHVADGRYTATLNLTSPGAYEIRATFVDADGVQYGTDLSDTVSLTTTLARYNVFLPCVIRQ